MEEPRTLGSVLTPPTADHQGASGKAHLSPGPSFPFFVSPILPERIMTFTPCSNIFQVSLKLYYSSIFLACHFRTFPLSQFPKELFSFIASSLYACYVPTTTDTFPLPINNTILTRFHFLFYVNPTAIFTSTLLMLHYFIYSSHFHILYFYITIVKF